jgi:hypothetical protein
VALYRSGLIPRVLATLGLIGYPVLLAGTVLDIFGVVDVTEGVGSWRSFRAACSS